MYVTTMWVQSMLERGHTAYEIGLIHNGGSTVEKEGYNSYGAYYNTAAYAQKIVAFINS